MVSLTIIVSGNAVAALVCYLCDRNYSYDDIWVFYFKLDATHKVTCMCKIQPGFRRGTIIDLKQDQYKN